jgi:sn-glycerol 3-phosphate transport system substrate-binding protein
MKKMVLFFLAVMLILPFAVFAGGAQEEAPAVEVGSMSEDGRYVPAEKVKLSFWHSYSGPRALLFEALVEEFMEANPKIKIELTYGGNLHTMRDKLLTSVAGKEAPDIAEIDSYWTPIFADAGALVDMIPYIEETGFDQSDLMDASLASTQYMGKSWSIPFNLSNIVLYYNKIAFKEAGLDPEVPPATWEELADYAEKLTIDKNGDGVTDQYGIVFPTKENYGAIWYYLAFFWQQDGQLFNADLTEGRFNTEAGVAAAQYWRDMVWKQKALNLSGGWSEFKVGNAAMELSSTSVLGNYREVMGNANVGLAPLPKGKKMATVSGGGNLAIFKDCKDPRAAWEFLSWMSSPEVNKRWCLSTGALPTRKSVLDSPEYQDFLRTDPKGQIMIDGLDFTNIRPNIPEYGDASRIIAQAVEKAVYDNLDPAPLLDEAKIEVDKLFKD